MKKNKTAAFLLLCVFCTSFLAPAFGITEDVNKKAGEVDILETINMKKWQKKNDPYLEGYIFRAIENNSDIKTTLLKIEEAKTNVTLIRANQLPTLSVGASTSLIKYPMSTKSEGSIAIPMYASYELDLFGKNLDKTKSAKKVLESTVFEAQSADISIISMVISTYYNIVNLDKIIEIQEKLTNNRELIYKLNKSANDEGIISFSDLKLSEKSYIMAQNDLIQYKKLRQNALNALAVLLGDSANNTENFGRISFDELTDNFEIPNEINSEIIVNRPDYKSLEKQLEASGLNIRAAKKEFLPSIDILGLLSFAATSTLSTMNWQNAIALLSGSVNLPLFTGFKRTANLKLNKNKYKQLVQAYEKTNLTAIQEVNDALYNLKADNEAFLNNKKAYEIQKHDFELVQSKFQKGVISKLELLNQEEAMLYVQKLLAKSKTDCLMDEIMLYKVTGAVI